MFISADRAGRTSSLFYSPAENCSSTGVNNQGSILLTVDVEDWFHVENFKKNIPFASWSSCELRVERNTHELLNFFDSLPTDSGDRDGSKPQATFFVLGWVAERMPELVREIQHRGHEIASHGYLHKLAGEHSTVDLIEDISASKKLLEDITGAPVNGYRAPSFSINPQVLRVIEECGYKYDSSFNSFSMNHRYGRLDLSKSPRMGIAYRLTENLCELPISNATILGCVMPAGGGAYFRLTPFPIFRWMARSLVESEGAYLFYMHPWELDAEQPRVRGLSLSTKLRHYTSLRRTLPKLLKLIAAFRGCAFRGCQHYLAQLETSEKPYYR